MPSNTMGYDVATFGNHEFDWGQDVLGDRVEEATYPYVSANIVVNDTGNCATAGWETPAFVDAPYEILTVGSPVSVKVGVIGVTTAEPPSSRSLKPLKAYVSRILQPPFSIITMK